MRLEITSFQVVGDGLQGGTLEYEPYLGVWTSFTQYRECRRINLAQATAAGMPGVFESLVPAHYELSDLLTQGVRGDESIWVQLFVHSMPSGVEDLDKERAGNVKLTLQAGLVQIPLGKFMAATSRATMAGTIQGENIMDPNLMFAQLMKDKSEGRSTNLELLQRRAMERSHKASVSVSFRLTGGDRATLETLAHELTPKTSADGTVRNPKTGALLYVPANYQHFAQALDKFVGVYVENFIGKFNPKTGEIGGAPKYDTRHESLKNLHFAVYRSPVGMLPVIAFWTHMAAQRHYTTEEERQATLNMYGFTKQTESLMEALLDSAIRAYGMTRESFLRAIREQHARPDSYAGVSDAYHTVLDIIVRMGSLVANAAFYMSDQRYVNKRSAADPGEEKDKPIGLESFDLVVMMLISLAGDCEDMANIVTTVLRMLTIGRRDLANNGSTRAWESETLEAARKVADTRALLDAGGDVTAAFLGADGKRVERKAIKDLPLIGSPEDKRNSTGGHAFGLWAPRAILAMWLERNGIGNTVLHKTKYPQWHYATRIRVLEGTGPMEPSGGVPVAEIFGPTSTAARKMDAAKAFVRDTLGQDEFKALTDAFRPYSLPFYTKNVEPARRISSFNLRVGPFASADLYAESTGLGMMMFINMETMERGVEWSVLLRDGIDGVLANCRIGLAAPYHGLEAQWAQHMVPAMEAMQNQMPLTALGSIPKYQNERPLHFGLLSQKTLDEKLASGTLAIHAPMIGNVTQAVAAMASPTAAAAARGTVRGRTQVFPASKRAEIHHSRAGTRPSKAVAEGRGGMMPGGTYRSLSAHLSSGRLSTDALAGTVEAQVGASSPLAAMWKRSIEETAASLGSEISWGRVQQLLGWYSGALQGTPHENLSLKAMVVEYAGAFGAAHGLTDAADGLAANGVKKGWQHLKEKHRKRKLIKAIASGAHSKRYTVQKVTPTRGIEGLMTLSVELACNPAVAPLASDSLALLHVSMLGRTFALAPLIVNAGAGVDIFAPPHSGMGALPEDSYIGHIERHSPTSATLSITVPTERHFAAAFCTEAHVVAEPWITQASNEALGSGGVEIVPSLLRQQALLSFDMGSPADIQSISPMVDCYARKDATLVRFMGHEWSLARNKPAVDAILRKLYDSGKLLAHEYMVVSPLPQCDDILELHLLIKV